MFALRTLFKIKGFQNRVWITFRGGCLKPAGLRNRSVNARKGDKFGWMVKTGNIACFD
jgi:hypothetical protein